MNKNFGIICGDDLEKLPTEELITVAKMNKNRDFLRQDNEHYHPGVLLSISEEFDRVNMINGFYWIVCINGKFDAEILKPI